MQFLMFSPFDERLKETKYRGSRKPDDNNDNDSLRKSFSELGILAPLILHQQKDGSLQLLDGFKRLGFARSQGIDAIPCSVLPVSTSIRQILVLIYQQKFSYIGSTFVSGLRFLRLAKTLKCDEREMLKTVLPLLHLDSHSMVLKKCEAILGLPSSILDFCEEKNFSMKQCLSLTTYPIDLLEAVFSLRHILSLTVSVIDELLTHLHDYLRAKEKTISFFLQDPEVRTLLDSKLSPQVKTQAFRSIVKKKRFPILTDVELQMDAAKKRMNLPNNVSLSWDGTLENRQLTFRLNVSRYQDWESSIGKLHENNVARGVNELLERF